MGYGCIGYGRSSNGSVEDAVLELVNVQGSSLSPFRSEVSSESLWLRWLVVASDDDDGTPDLQMGKPGAR